MRRRHLIIIVAVLGFCAVARLGTAAEPSGARLQFEQAKREYNLGAYPQALAGFERIYRTTGDPALLFNIGQCQRQLGRNADSLRSYRAFLREVPKAANREFVEAQIHELEMRLPKEEAPPAPAPGDKPVAPAEPIAPLPASAEPPAPPATPAPVTPTVPVVAPPPPETAALPSAPVPASPVLAPPAVPPSVVVSAVPQEEPASRRPIHGRWWFWAGIGAVVAGGVATAILLSGGVQDKVRGDLDPGIVGLR